MKYSTLLGFHRALYERDSMKGNMHCWLSKSLQYQQVATKGGGVGVLFKTFEGLPYPQLKHKNKCERERERVREREREMRS